MEKTAFDARYQEYLAAIEDYLNSLFAEKPHWADLYEAITIQRSLRRQAAASGDDAGLPGCAVWTGTRPCRLAALELVHTYSLIHDDLPCMDDDDLRRVSPPTTWSGGETFGGTGGETPSSLRPTA